MIDRTYAEQIAAKFDSLRSYKLLYSSSISTLEACENTTQQAAKALDISDKKNVLLCEEIAAGKESIMSKDRQITFLENNANILTNQLFLSEQKVKRQKVFGIIGGLAGGLIAGFIVGIIVK